METLREQAEAGEELRIKVEALEKDNGKLTAQNVHLVGHNNLKQRINMHAKVCGFLSFRLISLRMDQRHGREIELPGPIKTLDPET
jgi:hypothetical protein